MNSPEKNGQRFFPESGEDDLSSHAHRQLIGSVGLMLPLLLWLIAGWRPMAGLERWLLLDSVSAYYYTGAVSVFAGSLVALALFLFSYRGYANEYGRRDRIAALIAGVAALLVAFFPTEAPGVLPTPSWWQPFTGRIHYLSAVVLFASFIFFSLFQFPLSRMEQEKLPPQKQARNGVYIACGAAMVGCMVWAAYALRAGDSIFWPEALALEFFAISWLVKGRVDRTAAAVGRRTLYYGRHPRQLYDITLKTMRGERPGQAASTRHKS